MIILSRKKHESIVINDAITIFVVDIRGDKVRLGIEAPREVPVMRREVYDAIRQFNRRQGADLDAQLPAAPARGEPARSAPPCTESPREAPTAVAAPPTRDGLCCPECGSDAVDVARIKVAYQGKELVRRRKCTLCNNEFHTIERVETL